MEARRAEKIDHRRERDEQDLEKPDARQTEPAERAIAPVKDFVAMFPETLQRAVSPAKTLPRERAQGLRRFRPGDCVRRVNDAVDRVVQSEGQIGILRQRVEAQPADRIDGRATKRADRAGHDRDAVPAIVGAPVEIEAAGVFERLTARDETAQVADFGVTGNCDDVFVAHRADEQPQSVALANACRRREKQRTRAARATSRAAERPLCRDFACLTSRTRGSFCAIFSTSAAVPSREPSSTTNTSISPAIIVRENRAQVLQRSLSLH